MINMNNLKWNEKNKKRNENNHENENDDEKWLRIESMEIIVMKWI